MRHELASRYGGVPHSPMPTNVRRGGRRSRQHAGTRGERRMSTRPPPSLTRPSRPPTAGSSAPVATFALGVRADRPEEVDPAEVGPVGLAEVELALGRLPQQEAAQPLLAGGTD